VPDFEVVGQASNGIEAVDEARKYQPDVVIMDIRMPGGNGVESTAAIKKISPQIKVLILTVSDRDDDLFAAIKNGADGYLLKNCEIEELVNGIIHTARGETSISPVMATKLLNEFKSGASKRHATPYSHILSEREEEVLKLVGYGSTNKDVAEALFVTENTVKCHMRNIMSKLHAKSRYQLVIYAIKKELATD
jgi:DNA-binding NarL/FixJ family response regulator